jgi:hypothetical protein
MFLIIVSSTVSFGQVISQLSSWSNNANFVIKYYQDRVITSTTSGIMFINVSNPFNPVPSASLGNPGSFPTAIAIHDNYVFFGGGMTGYFMIADISNLNFPFQTGITQNISGTAYQIASNNDFAFMPTNSDTLYSIDIVNKNAPAVKGKLNLGSFSSGITLNGNYAYVGTTNGLKVVDISNPVNMFIVNSFGGGYGKIVPDLANNRLFVSKTGQGFDVIDVSSPANPVGLFQGLGGNSGGDLDYHNGIVFQNGSGNVSAFQVGSSSSTYIGSFNSTFTGQVNGITVKDTVFYVSTVNHLHVLKLGTPPSGIINPDLQHQIHIFPNPVSDVITLQSNVKMTRSLIHIINLVGQTLISVNFDELESSKLDVSKLPEGLYFITMANKDITIKSRFIKHPAVPK